MSAYVYVSYPKKEGSWFDMDYYLNTHMALVKKHWGPFGMHSWTIVQFQDNDASGMHVQAVMLWESVEAFEKAIEANIPEVMEDVKYYSDQMPVRWYAKVMQQG